ncbi:hypothetical protein WJX81_002885 [Elliptochloris bilobata]|uniref:Nucleotide exchange factor Fes1 domain-containing protein n=1 Tax=Elliptochloris bilobata TaxID=381761 RepID=A0AAW1RG91_9CHLO
MYSAVLQLNQVQAAPNASAKHGSYEAADLSVAKDALAEGQELQDLLHWAITHSDAEALRQSAEKGESLEEALARRHNVQQLIDHLKQEPTEVELLKAAIAELRNQTATPEDTTAALEAVQLLVEPIDLANDLSKLGGLEPLLHLLGSEQPPAVQASAAHALGTAAANNNALQALLLTEHPDVFKRLVSVVGSRDPAAATKALYCAAGLARNSREGAQALLDAGGLDTAVSLLSETPEGAPRPAALRRKALSLLADLALVNPQGVGAKLESSVGASAVTAALREQLAVAANEKDWDTAERALLALKALTAVPAVAKQLHGQHPESELDALASALRGNAGLNDEYRQELLTLVAAARDALALCRTAASERTEL